jgi:hypothetical protein
MRSFWFASALVCALALSFSARAQPRSEEMYAPRVMYWWGKVNQHFDAASGQWQTDPDGRSGADLDMLQYCRRWYPATVTVRPFTEETIHTWRAAGNTGAYTSTQRSHECVQPFVPRVMYWWGKVNQHIDPNGQWQTDPDGTSGANIDMFEYCRRWYPETRRVVPFARETISTWREAGNVGAHTSEQTSYWCMP